MANVSESRGVRATPSDHTTIPLNIAAGLLILIRLAVTTAYSRHWRAPDHANARRCLVPLSLLTEVGTIAELIAMTRHPT